MKVRIIVGMWLLVGVLCSSWALAQGTGSGGIASDPVAAAASQSPANTSLFQVITGPVDHAAAGTGLRNFDSGVIRLRGIPPNSTVVRAFLYWAMICPTGTDCPRIVPIEFDGRTVDSTIICLGAPPCWPGSALGAYRVNVTGLMPGTTPAVVANKVINGDYRVNAFPSGDRDGSDPWTTSKPPLIEGATLVVVYSNPSLPTTGRVYIHQGCDMFSGTLDATNVLTPTAPSPLSFVKFTRFGADGQVGTGITANPITSHETTFFGGPSATCSAAPLTQIAGDGSTLDRDSDWNGHDGEPMNQLWDTHTTDVTGLLGPGASNYCVRYVSSGDCMNAIGYVLTTY